MKKYFFLQSKRLCRYLPGAFLVVVILLGGLAGVLGMMMDQQSQSQDNTKFQIGVVGSTDDPLLEMGISALSYYDSSRFAMELKSMTEEQARNALSLGKISAYIVVPDNFVDEALYGNIIPLKFVSTIGATGVISIVQKEITGTISRILLDAQKGVYGMYYATGDNGIHMTGQMNDMPLEYTEYVFLREKTYSLTELGIGDGLDLGGYLMCGFLVLFLLLSCLPFAPLMIHRDASLRQMLAARGRSAFLQTLCDFVSYALALIVMVLAVACVALAVPSLADFGKLLLQAIPAALLAAAMSYMLYSLATDLIGGVLLQFFVTLAMCFVSGCLYPVYFFPSAVQQLAAWLPTGVARSQLAGTMTGSGSWLSVVLILAYSAVFFLIGSTVSCARARGVHR